MCYCFQTFKDLFDVYQEFLPFCPLLGQSSLATLNFV